MTNLQKFLCQLDAIDNGKWNYLPIVTLRRLRVRLARAHDHLLTLPENWCIDAQRPPRDVPKPAKGRPRYGQRPPLTQEEKNLILTGKTTL